MPHLNLTMTLCMKKYFQIYSASQGGDLITTDEHCKENSTLDIIDCNEVRGKYQDHCIC